MIHVAYADSLPSTKIIWTLITTKTYPCTLQWVNCIVTHTVKLGYIGSTNTNVTDNQMKPYLEGCPTGIGDDITKVKINGPDGEFISYYYATGMETQWKYPGDCSNPSVWYQNCTEYNGSYSGGVTVSIQNTTCNFNSNSDTTVADEYISWSDTSSPPPINFTLTWHLTSRPDLDYGGIFYDTQTCNPSGNPGCHH